MDKGNSRISKSEERFVRFRRAITKSKVRRMHGSHTQLILVEQTLFYNLIIKIRIIRDYNKSSFQELAVR